ncbi:MAG: quinolinate synthase NadA [Candidatus Hydrogenedentes bacterium]|nr:quinolinate synthase NadA [Candidatus Hydrogenedentota bacterium]
MANPLPLVQEAGSEEEAFERMKAKLRGLLSESEIRAKAGLAFEINRLKRERNAVILGHNYMEPALYASVPDYTGDSLQLARISAKTDADIILFCGVLFMAESAKILNPDKLVLIPNEKAGCSLAEGVSAADVRGLKERFPGVPVVTYVNTYAETKAESDYCCTSGNAGSVVRHVLNQGHSRVIFLPDEFLARNTAREVGVPFVPGWEDSAPEQAAQSERAIIGWNARCEVHELYTVEDVEGVRKQYPDVTIIAHPECPPEVIERVDIAGSTKKMVEYVAESDTKQFLLFTECSMGDNIAVENPDKEMLRLCSHRCPHMALITLEDTLASLQKLQIQVELAPDIIERSRRPIDRMLEIH